MSRPIMPTPRSTATAGVRRSASPDDRRHYAMVDALRAEGAEMMAATDALLVTLPVLHDCQWYRSPPSPAEQVADAGIRSKNAVDDPTGETAIDARRLRVRRELRTASAHLLKANALLRGTNAAIDRALTAWSNATP